MKNEHAVKPLSLKERHSLKVWYVHRKIEQSLLLSKDGLNFEYWTYSPPYYATDEFPSPREESIIIEQLIHKKGLKRNEPDVIAEIGTHVTSDQMQQAIAIYSLQASPKLKELDRECQRLIKHLPKKDSADFISIKDVQQKQSAKERYSCGLLYVDFDNCVLRYAKNPAIEISPETQEMKLLKLLLKNNAIAQSGAQYWQIAKETSPRVYVGGMNDNKRYARHVQFIRRNLGGILKEAGMTESEIDNMIVGKTNFGYSLRCQ